VKRKARSCISTDQNPGKSSPQTTLAQYSVRGGENTLSLKNNLTKMKNTIFSILAFLFFAVSASAQSTADSISAKYKLLPMPEALTIEKTFPVIGQYTLSNADASQPAITIALDSSNKGIVWIDGLAQGKIKAYLKKAPSTYRIPAQKSESGKSIAEGTVMYDKENNVLNIAIGGGYNEADPAAIFANATAAAPVTETKVKVKTANSKTKNKVIFYSAVKAGTSSTAGTSNSGQ
jgi:hypothetical protein